MNRPATGRAVMAVATLLCAVPAAGADDPASDVTTVKDLTAVIALQGLPCGQVMSVTAQGENDYVASCQDGNRYRVFVNAEGRVVVEKK